MGARVEQLEFGKRTSPRKTVHSGMLKHAMKAKTRAESQITPGRSSSSWFIGGCTDGGASRRPG